MERAKRILYDYNRVRPKCIICPKINSRTFESEDERRLHTGVEVYENFFGIDYEKEMRAATERTVDSLMLFDFDRFDRTLVEMKEMQKSFWNKMDRLLQCCDNCRDCYYECPTDLPRYEKLFDIIETRRPLLFDVRIDYFDSVQRLVSEEDANPDDHLVPPCESEDEISLD